MSVFADLFLSFYFVAFFSSWLFSVLFKSIFYSVITRSNMFVRGFQNGGWPSSHSAVVSSITLSIALVEGLTSTFFVSLIFSLIIMSDSFGVRQFVGKQGDLFNSKVIKSEKNFVKVVYGHTFWQVVVGSLCGILVTSVIFWLWF